MKLKKENKGGIVGTVVVNVSIIVLLFFLGFHTPLPLPEEEGILVDFGYNETGLGEIEPEVKEEQEEESVEVSSSEEEIVTSELDDTPEIVVHKDNETEKKEEVIEEEKKEEERVVNPNVLFPPTDNSNNSSSQGVAGGDGNQGKPDGGDSDNYTGSGQGNSGISYSLKGRHHKGLPKPLYTGNEEGKVVVEITVNRNGIVTSATPGIKGTTTSASNLWAAAKKAAMKTKFDKSSSSPKMQTGTIVYHFVLR